MSVATGSLSRTQIAAAVPACSRIIRGQLEALRHGLACPALREVRADFARNLAAWWRIHVNHASWGGPGRLARGLSAPTRARVCELAGFSVSTYKACRRWWEAAGYVAVVRPGWTPALRPAGLADPDEPNETQIYILCAPRTPDRTTPRPGEPTGENTFDAQLTRPLTGSRRELVKVYPARGNKITGKPGAERDQETTLRRPRALSRGPLRQLTDGWWAHLTAPFTGWTARDFTWAVDHLPDGRQHPYAVAAVRHPAGWLRWRLSRWLGDDGRPLPSRSQQLAASAQASRAAAAAHREQQAAAVARRGDADYAAGGARARALLAARPRRGVTADPPPPGGTTGRKQPHMRIALDAARWEAIADIAWPHKIGYYNGSLYAWKREEIQAARAKGQLLALIDVTGADWQNAAILDVEKGDVPPGNAGLISSWVRSRNSRFGDACVYCDRSNLPAVISALTRDHWNLWLAAPTGDGEPPFDVPDLGLPRNVRLVGIQYFLGGAYDLSLFYDDSWHRQPGDQARITLALAGNGVPPQIAAAASRLPALSEPDPAPADVSRETPASGDTANLGSEPPPDVSRETAPTTPDLPAAPPEITAAAAPAPIPVGPSPDRLPHQWIQDVLKDAGRVAALLRGSGANAAAIMLEQGIQHAAEIGSILMKAGL